jgi:hypothetical protein
MKKTKFYFIVPVVIVGIFSAYYLNFSSHYDEDQAKIAAAAKQARIDKLNAEAERNAAAIKDAVAAQVVRKAERAAKDARERQQKDDKENALLERDKAEQESQKLQRQSEKLEKDVASTKEDIEKIKADQKEASEEITFLKQYTAEAQANQGKLADVVAKIEAADLATQRAAALAAAQAKKNNN